MSITFKLSQDKRTLFYLDRFNRYADAWEVPIDLTQDGMSKNLDILLNNVSRSLSSLSKEGLIGERLAHVTGVERRRTVYFLSEKGKSLINQIKSELDKEIIDIINIDGQRIKKTLSELITLLEKDHGVICTYFDLLEYLSGNETVSVSDIIKVMESRKSPKKKLVHQIEKAPVLRQFYGRESEINDITSCIDSETCPIIMIQGIAGIGKSTLAAKILEKYKDSKNLFWYHFHEWDSTKSVLQELTGFLFLLGRTKTESHLKKNKQPEMNVLLTLLEMDFDNINAIMVFDDLQKTNESMKQLLAVIVDLCDRIIGVNFIFITRENIRFYDQRDSIIRKKIKEISLYGLDEKNSLKIINFAVDEKQGKDIYEITKGHPLFLELLNISGSLLGRKDIDDFLGNEIYSKLSIDDKTVQEYLSVYRYPVTLDGILLGNINYEIIMAATKKNLLRELQDKRYEPHDILRDFIYKRLPEPKKVLYHRIAAKYYTDIEEHSQIADIESIYHMQKAGLWPEAAAQAIQKCPSLIDLNYQELNEILCAFRPQDLSKEQWADLLYLKAEFHLSNEEWYLALNNYLECLAVAESIGSEPNKLATVHNSIAVVQSNIDNWEEARNSQEKAFDLYEKSDDKLGMAKTSINLGILYRKNKDYETARKHYNNALKILKDSGNVRGTAAVFNNIGFLHLDKGDWTSAIDNLKTALNISVQESDTLGQAMARRSMGEVYATRGNFEDAYLNLEISFKLFRNLGDYRNCLDLAEKLGDLHYKTDERKEAIEWYQSGINLIEEKPYQKLGAFFDKKKMDSNMMHHELRTVANLYSKIATIERQDKSFIKCRENREKAIDNLAKVNDNSAIAKEYLELALDLEAEGKIVEGIQKLKNALEILKKGKDIKGETVLKFNLGRMFELTNNYSEAVENYSFALDLAEMTNNWLGAAHSAEHLAMLIAKNDPKKSKEFSKKAIMYYNYTNLPREAKRVKHDLK